MLDEVYRLAALFGATDKQIAEYYDVNVTTVDNWKRRYPEFDRILRKGKMEADSKVAQSLYQRATGYEHEDIYITTHKGMPITVPYKKHYPPDTQAALRWLSIRRRQEWSETVNINHQGEVNHTHRKIEDIPMDELSEAQKEMLFDINMKQLMHGSNSN
jgi:hypothetical protein